jgi:hypothetical protein
MNDREKLNALDPNVFRNRWKEVLPSGEYLQTTGVLRETLDGRNTVQGYCCLGVACDILSKEYGIGHWGKGDDYEWKFCFDEQYASTTLPHAIYRWIGIALQSTEDQLINANDSGDDFDTIAEMI